MVTPDSTSAEVPRPRAPRAPRATGTTDATGARTPQTPSEAAARAAAKDRTTGPDDTGGTGGTRGAGPGAEAKPRATRTPALEAKLQQFFSVPSLMFGMAGDQYCAEIVALRAPMLASSWYELSKQNASVKRMLEGLVEGSAWGGVILSTLAVALPIASHHGLYRGPDPFAAFLPTPDTPPRQHGASEGAGQGRAMTWTKDPSGPAPSPFVPPMTGGPGVAVPPASGDDDDHVPNVPGAPPGVVTVAASGAQHNGAR